MQKDVYQKVTDKIIADLEKGELTWIKPWSSGNMEGRIVRPLRHNGIPYKGINVLMLWGAALEKGFVSPYWMTYRQAGELGAQVRKGEKGTSIIYANTLTKVEEGEDGAAKEQHVPFLRGYAVFNADQIEGLPVHYLTTPTTVIDPVQRIADVESFFAATGADIRHGGDEAHYDGRTDHVQLPPFESFRSPEAYYATLAHELTHWTRHTSRLARDFGRERWGDEGYAKEELVAELGAAFLCADLGLTPEPGEHHAAYIQHWLKVLMDDKRAIFRAASHAQRATDFLHGFQAKEEEPQEGAAA